MHTSPIPKRLEYVCQLKENQRLVLVLLDQVRTSCYIGGCIIRMVVGFTTTCAIGASPQKL